MVKNNGSSINIVSAVALSVEPLIELGLVIVPEVCIALRVVGNADRHYGVFKMCVWVRIKDGRYREVG